MATISLVHGIHWVKIGCLSNCGLGHSILNSHLALDLSLILSCILDLKHKFHWHTSLLADPHLAWIHLWSPERNKAWSGGLGVWLSWLIGGLGSRPLALLSYELLLNMRYVSALSSFMGAMPLIVAWGLGPHKASTWRLPLQGVILISCDICRLNTLVHYSLLQLLQILHGLHGVHFGGWQSEL